MKITRSINRDNMNTIVKMLDGIKNEFNIKIKDYPKTEVKVRVLGYVPIPKNWR